MGRWSQYDEDSYRLPEGMVRIGYDADTEIYTYRDKDGSRWEGVPGNRYGVLRRAGKSSSYVDLTESHPSLPHRIVYDDPNTPSSAYDQYDSPSGFQVCRQFFSLPFKHVHRTISDYAHMPSSIPARLKHSNRRHTSASQRPLLGLSRTWSGSGISRCSSSLIERTQSPRDSLLNGARPRERVHHFDEKQDIEQGQNEKDHDETNDGEKNDNEKFDDDDERQDDKKIRRKSVGRVVAAEEAAARKGMARKATTRKPIPIRSKTS